MSSLTCRTTAVFSRRCVSGSSMWSFDREEGEGVNGKPSHLGNKHADTSGVSTAVAVGWPAHVIDEWLAERPQA